MSRLFFNCGSIAVFCALGTCLPQSAVAHLAAQPGVRHSLIAPDAYLRNNVTAFGHVLEGCRHAGTRHLVYASSSSVYGANHALPFSEDQRVDLPVAVEVPRRLNGLSFTADGTLAGIIDTPCSEVTDCAPSFASWSPADLTLLGERPGRAGTYDTNVVNARGFGAAFACSPWNGLCALGLKDVRLSLPGADRVAVTLSDGAPVRELTVPAAANLMAFAPDGQMLAVLSVDNGPVQVFNVDDGKLVASLSFDLNVP